MALAKAIPVLASVPPGWTLVSAVPALKRSAPPPPLNSFFPLNPRNAPNLKVCAPFTHVRSSRTPYKSSLLLQGASSWGGLAPCPVLPVLMTGNPSGWLFTEEGKRVGKAELIWVNRPALVPPAVTRIRLFEYENSASLMRWAPSMEVTLPTIDFEGWDQLLSSVVKPSSPQ